MSAFFYPWSKENVVHWRFNLWVSHLGHFRHATTICLLLDTFWFTGGFFLDGDGNPRAAPRSFVLISSKVWGGPGWRRQGCVQKKAGEDWCCLQILRRCSPGRERKLDEGRRPDLFSAVELDHWKSSAVREQFGLNLHYTGLFVLDRQLKIPPHDACGRYLYPCFCRPTAVKY